MKLFTQILLSLVGFGLLTSCGLLDRRIQKQTNNLNETSVEEALPTKTRLKQLENAIGTRKEADQYSKALPWFKDEAERIEFLTQIGFEARQQWLSERDFNSRATRVQDQMKSLVEAQDIVIGMPQTLVRKSWGDPEAIEVSGNPLFKNERWKYSKYVSGSEGYKPEKKIVYFEGGKVVAWEQE